MLRIFGWLIFLAVVYYGWQAGWFSPVVNYFSEASRAAREEKVIEHEDGSITTVKYRNVFDVLTSGKN